MYGCSRCWKKCETKSLVTNLTQGFPTITQYDETQTWIFSMTCSVAHLLNGNMSDYNCNFGGLRILLGCCHLYTEIHMMVYRYATHRVFLMGLVSTGHVLQSPFLHIKQSPAGPLENLNSVHVWLYNGLLLFRVMCCLIDFIEINQSIKILN